MHKNIAAFGEVMMRLEVPGFDLLPQAHALHYSFSGTGVNVAGALAAFGYPCFLISVVPDNPLGSAALSYLRKLGIRTDYVLQDGEQIGMYFLENGFGPRPSRVTYAGRAHSSFNTAPEGSYPWKALVDKLDVIHFCGITLAMNDQVRKHARTLAELAHVQGKMVVFDCNYRPALWGEGGYAKAREPYEEMLRLADIVLMNERDAMHVLGLPTDKNSRREQLEELIPLVAERYDISVIAGTHRTIESNGDHTLYGYIYQNQKLFYSDAVTFPVFSRIGAGDAYTSGIVHGVLKQFTPERTVEFAVTASMLAHTVAGDTPIASEADVLRAMSKSADRDVER